MSFTHVTRSSNFNIQSLHGHGLWPISLQQVQRKKRKQQQYRQDLKRQIQQNRKIKKTNLQYHSSSYIDRSKMYQSQLSNKQTPTNLNQSSLLNKKIDRLSFYKSRRPRFQNSHERIQSRVQERYVSQNKNVQGNYIDKQSYLSNYSNLQKAQKAQKYSNMRNSQQRRNRLSSIRWKTEGNSIANLFDDQQSQRFEISRQKRKAEQQDILNEKIHQIYVQLNHSIVSLRIQDQIRRVHNKIKQRTLNTQIDEHQYLYLQPQNKFLLSYNTQQM